MSDFTDYVQTELPFRTSIDVIAATGSLLVKVNNTFSRDYQALSQGLIDQVLVSAGANSAPGWTQSLALLYLEVDNIAINDNKITSSTGTVDFNDEDLTTTGIINCSHIKALATEGLILEPTLGKAIQATASGDARGTYSVDFQTWRDNVNQVASGNYSVICGGTRNRTTGDQSFIGGGNDNVVLASTGLILGGAHNDLLTAATSSAIMSGSYNEVSNYNSVIVGGRYNSISGHDSFINGGLENSISEMYSVVNCGYNNSITSQYSFIGCGANNVISGYQGVIGGGSNNIINAVCEQATIPGGARNETDAHFTTAINYYAKARLYGEFAQASGKFAVVGDSQTSILTARNKTTNATQTVLFLNGSSLRLTMTADTTWLFNIHVVAHRDTALESAGYQIQGVIRKESTNDPVIVNSIKTVIAEDDATWDADVRVDTTNDALEIYVTGAAAKTIQWNARVELTITLD